MANNRIYLKCKACGKELYLGKHFLSAFYYVNYDETTSLEEKLNKFYDEHEWCQGGPLECFTISYEFED